MQRLLLSYARVIFMLAGIVLISASARAAEPKIGLVLAGGGAAGLTHVGVIRELERLGIRPDCVVGTSMGAIIGGLYAAGYSADELERVVLDIDWETILNDYSDRSTLHPMRRDSRIDPFSVAADLPLGRDDEGVQFVGGLIDGIKLTLLLRELTSRAHSATTFDQLPIPFRAIATDLETGAPVVMRKGDLALALRASMSIPGLLPAVERDGRILVDGGVVNNFPTDIARKLCADIVIGINLPSPLPDRRSLASVTGTVAQLVSLIVGRQEKTNEASMTEQDILIVPPVAHIRLLGFSKAAEAVEIGSQATLAHRDQLQALASMRAPIVANDAARPASQSSLIKYDALVIENDSGLSDKVISALLGLSPSGEIEAYELQRRLLKIYGLDLFSSVSYKLEEQATQRNLIVTSHKKSSGNSEFRLGIGLQDDFEGEGDYILGFGSSFTQLNELGARVDIDTVIGSNVGGRLVFEQPTNYRQSRFIQAHANLLSSTVPIYLADERIADFRTSEASAGVNLIWAPYESLRVGVGTSYRWNRVKLKTGDPSILRGVGLTEDWQGDLRVGALFDYDTLDRPDMPRSGRQLYFRLDVDSADNNENVGQVLIDGLFATSLGNYTLAGFLRVDAELDPDGLDPHFLGGFQRLSGLARDQLFGNIALLSGARVYRNFSFDSLFGQEAFIGASLEYGGVWNQWRDVTSEEALMHGSVFSGVETPVGPLFLGLGFGEQGEWAGHLSLGRRF